MRMWYEHVDILGIGGMYCCQMLCAGMQAVCQQDTATLLEPRTPSLAVPAALLNKAAK
jgi:hypothetical protein